MWRECLHPVSALFGEVVPLVAGGAGFGAVEVVLLAQELMVLLSCTAALGAVLLLVGVIAHPAVHSLVHLGVVTPQLARIWPAGSAPDCSRVRAASPVLGGVLVSSRGSSRRLAGISP